MSCKNASECFEGLYEGIGLSREEIELLEVCCDKNNLLFAMRYQHSHFKSDDRLGIDPCYLIDIAFVDDLLEDKKRFFEIYEKVHSHLKSDGGGISPCHLIDDEDIKKKHYEIEKKVFEILEKCRYSLHEKLSEAGFFNEVFRSNCIHLDDFLHEIFNGAYEWGILDEVYDELYESQNEPWDIKHSRIMKLLEEGLTPSQYEMIRFEDSCPEFWRWYELTSQEKLLLEAAHNNILNIFAERIFEIVAS